MTLIMPTAFRDTKYFNNESFTAYLLGISCENSLYTANTEDKVKFLPEIYLTNMSLLEPKVSVNTKYLGSSMLQKWCYENEIRDSQFLKG